MEGNTDKELNLVNQSGSKFSLAQEIKSRLKQAVLTVRQCEDALRDPFLVAQEGATF